jgi:acetate---CoA ligase (ADP-forming)
LDVTGAAVIDPGLFTEAVVTVSEDPSVGIVGVVNTLPWISDGTKWHGQAVATAVGRGIARAEVPVVYINQVMQPQTSYSREIMAEADIPYVIAGLRHAIVAIHNVGRWSQSLDALESSEQSAPIARVSDPTAGPRMGAWSEHGARQLLSDAGIAVVPAALVDSEDEAMKAAAGFGWPVVLKVVSPEIVHKSDVGGVCLNVHEEAMSESYRKVLSSAQSMNAPVEGVLVAPMRSGGIELLVGVVRDPQWGPMLAVALGGVFAELLQDSVIAPLPVGLSEAQRMLRELRGSRVFAGVRGQSPVDLSAAASLVQRVGALALALGDELESLELNPVLLSGSSAEALDVLVTWVPQ